MPGIGGEDQLSPEYAPWAWIGPDDDLHFVWQTSQKAEHDGWLYRAGKTGKDEVVCERRPLEDTPLGTLRGRERIETVPTEQIPPGLFPDLQSMKERVAEVRSMLDQVEPTVAAGDQLAAQVNEKVIKNS